MKKVFLTIGIFLLSLFVVYSAMFAILKLFFPNQFDSTLGRFRNELLFEDTTEHCEISPKCPIGVPMYFYDEHPHPFDNMHDYIATLRVAEDATYKRVDHFENWFNSVVLRESNMTLDKNGNAVDMISTFAPSTALLTLSSLSTYLFLRKRKDSQPLA